MFLKVLKWVACLFPARVIHGPDEVPYLIRFRIFGDAGNVTPPKGKFRFPFSIFIHRFLRPDADRHLHSHPWKWSFSFVLAGGYMEERANEWEGWGPPYFNGVTWFRFVYPFRLNFFGKGDFHRIHRLNGKETWTLFIAGPKIRDWGFLVPNFGVIPHEEYFREWIPGKEWKPGPLED